MKQWKVQNPPNNSVLVNWYGDLTVHFLPGLENWSDLNEMDLKCWFVGSVIVILLKWIHITLKVCQMGWRLIIEKEKNLESEF